MQVNVRYQPTKARLEDGVFFCEHPSRRATTVTVDVMTLEGADNYEEPAVECEDCNAQLDMEFEDYYNHYTAKGVN